MARKSDHQHESAPRWLWGLGLALAALALGSVLQLEGSATGDYLRQLEHASLDTRFVLRERFAPTRADPDIVILTVDDWGVEAFEFPHLVEGLANFPETPWPWPRVFYGLAARHLAAAGARAVFFDFTFTGPSVHQTLGEEDDPAFAQLAAQAGNVYHTLVFQGPLDRGADDEPADVSVTEELHQILLERLLAGLPAGKLEAAAVPIEHAGLTEYRNVEVPNATLAATARGFGSVNATLDPDGVVRRIELAARFRGATYPAISLALAAELLGAPIGWDGRGPWITLGERRIPVDERGRMLLDWHGGAKTYPTRPLHKLILELLGPDADPERDRGLYAGKVVLVGTSALGLADLKATPFGAYYPGIEVHATALDNILNGDFVHRPSGTVRALIAGSLLAIGGLLMTRRQGAGAILGVYLTLLALYTGAALGAFLVNTTWLDLVLPCAGLSLVFGGAQAFQYFTEGRQKREIKSAFQRYLPPAVVNEVLKLPADELRLGGDRRELTVFFSDIAGFTTVSERLEPEELVGLLNTYLGAMSDIVSDRRGTLDKYIGDCVMAFWGAPLALENGAVEACLAALECQRRGLELNRELAQQGLPELVTRIGLNTGPMLVGNMGSERHFNFTVMGDAVNLASRLEGANKAYGTTILIGPLTAERARDAIEVRPLDLLRVKGKLDPVEVFELLAPRGELPEARVALLEAWGAALGHYRARDWGAALSGFEACLALDPEDGPAQTYRDRCVVFLERPPSADWDGVYEMRTK